jgi:hypothetical protein
MGPPMRNCASEVKPGTTLSMWSVYWWANETYASPSVSNIAALMASDAVLPAQTTNWNAG